LAQISTVIPDSEAAQHIGQNATVEGVVTAVSTIKKGNTFINFGGVYPNQTFTGWIPAGTPLASDPSIISLQGKRIKITGLIELYVDLLKTMAGHGSRNSVLQGPKGPTQTNLTVATCARFAINSDRPG
jgi:hypothetical protein